MNASITSSLVFFSFAISGIIFSTLRVEQYVIVLPSLRRCGRVGEAVGGQLTQACRRCRQGRGCRAARGVSPGLGFGLWARGAVVVSEETVRCEIRWSVVHTEGLHHLGEFLVGERVLRVLVEEHEGLLNRSRIWGGPERGEALRIGEAQTMLIRSKQGTMGRCVAIKE